MNALSRTQLNTTQTLLKGHVMNHRQNSLQTVCCRLVCGLMLVACMAYATAAHSATTFNSGSISSGANWTNGLPTVGNDGTIAASGTYNLLNFNEPTAGTVTISHTAGAITQGDTDWNFRNDAAGGATYNWNQSGGSLTTRVFNVNNRVVYTLTGSGQLISAGVRRQPH